MAATGSDVWGFQGTANPPAIGTVADIDFSGPNVPNRHLEVNVSATFISTTLQIQKVVGYNSEVGFTEQVTCSVVGQDAIDVYLPFLSDGTPDAANPPNSDWTVVDGNWQTGFGAIEGATCTVNETDQGDAVLVRYACDWTPGLLDGVAPRSRRAPVAPDPRPGRASTPITRERSTWKATVIPRS